MSSRSNTRASSSSSSLAWGFLCGVAVTTTVSTVVMLWMGQRQERLRSRRGPKYHHDDDDESENNETAMWTMPRGDDDLVLLEEDQDDQESTLIKSNTLLMDDVNLDLRLIRKAEGVLQLRTSRLIVVVERCVNDHNYSAILRTTEALGIQHVWMIDPPLDNNSKETTELAATTSAPQHVMDMQGKAIAGGLSVQELEDRNRHRLFAQGATEWLTLRNFATTRECIQALRDEHYKIYVTDLSQQAVPLTRRALAQVNEWPILGPITQQSQQQQQQPLQSLAICFGTEAVGCTQELLQAADLRVYLPLRGFADSLNLSVATALVLHHLCTVLEPRFFGDGCMAEAERVELRRAWYTKLAQQRLLTSRDKKRRKKLKSDIQRAELLQAKLLQEGGGSSSLTPEQLEKVSKLPQMRREVEEIEASAHFHHGNNKTDDSVDSTAPHYHQVLEEWLANPPQPLTDLRRVDSHRISYVGKGTKKRQEEYWKDMAAINPNKISSEHGSSAKYFRKVLNP